MARRGRKVIDLTGQTFGQWRVVARSEKPSHITNGTRSAWWLCRCVCGTESVVPAYNLRHRGSRSCGCAPRDRSRGRSKAERNVQMAAARSAGMTHAQIGERFDVSRQVVEKILKRGKGDEHRGLSGC